MFRNRELKVSVEKTNKKKEQAPPTVVYQEKEDFSEKFEKAVKILEKTAVKAFAGFCIYIALDTVRQVAIENAQNQNND